MKGVDGDISVPFPSDASTVYCRFYSSNTWLFPFQIVCIDNFVILQIQCGPGSSSGKALGYGLDGLGSFPGVGGVEIFLLLCIQTGPDVHSASYKMSTGGGGKGGRAQDQPSGLSLALWLCICGPLHPHPPWAFMACNVDTFTFYRYSIIKDKVQYQFSFLRHNFNI